MLDDEELTAALWNEIAAHAASADGDSESVPYLTRILCLVATTMDVPAGFIYYVYTEDNEGVSGPTSLDHRIDELLTAQGVDRCAWSADVGRLAFEVASRRPLPPGVQNAARGGATGSWRRATALAVAVRNGDRATVDEYVVNAANTGCTSPVAWLAQQEPEYLDRPDLLTDLLGLDALVEMRGWGSIAQVACLLATAHRDADALAWSGAVLDDQLVTSDRASQTTHPRLHGALCTPRCRSDEANLLAPLAFIDAICGGAERGLARASRYDSGRDHQGWKTAGHRAMAEWVRAGSLQTADRQIALEAIGPRHAWLGLLQAQILADLAEIAQDNSDDAEYQRLSVLAVQAQASPRVCLHVGAFEYDDLLERLPIQGE